MDPDLVARITRTHGIRLLLQFGSTVTGHEHPRSDVDLAVEFGEVPGRSPRSARRWRICRRSSRARGGRRRRQSGRSPLPGSNAPLVPPAARRPAAAERAEDLRFQAISGSQAVPRARAAVHRPDPGAGRCLMIDRELVTRKSLLIARDLEPLGERTLPRTDHRAHHRHQLPPDHGGWRRTALRLLLASFVELGRLGVLDPAFAQRLAPSAGLRNRLVHEYDEVDPVKLHEACRAATIDVPGYLRAVDAWLERSGPLRPG